MAQERSASHASRASTGTVVAAGAIVWRFSPAGDLELLVVHSARWNEWSWPKGKLKHRESLAVGAVREILEETGAQVELGAPLPPVSYVLPDGRPKTVHYWTGRPRRAGERTAGATEIDDVAWLPVEEALSRLRPGDAVPARALLERAANDVLDTTPLLVVRHAKARARANWKGGEADRPLTRTGERQAAALARLLTAWRPAHLLSSPWSRCTETLRPYLEASIRDDETGHRRTEPEILPFLSEQGLKDEPGRVAELVAELVAAGEGALVCTHRPVLAEVVAALTEPSSVAVRDQLPRHDPWLSPAEVLVAHVTRAPGGRPRIVAAEQHVSRS